MINPNIKTFINWMVSGPTNSPADHMTLPRFEKGLEIINQLTGIPPTVEISVKMELSRELQCGIEPIKTSFGSTACSVLSNYISELMQDKLMSMIPKERE